MKQYQTAITSAIKHIQEQQLPEGGFLSYSSTTADDFKDAVPRLTTFFTSNILLCSQSLPETPERNVIRRAAVRFLLDQRSGGGWFFNYWARSAPERTSLPYPDDLDDTFAALAALLRYDRAIIDGRAFSAIAAMLIGQEVHPGGPYRTWIASRTAPDAWRDIDPAVNATVAYFLALADVRLPHVKNFVDDIAQKEERLTSPYYRGPFPLIYFISRFYAATGIMDAPVDALDAILEKLVQRNKPTINPLEQAMAISSLVNLGHIAQALPLADDLVVRIAQEGFRPYPFCIDPSRGGKRCYAGTSALTAAFCAEALARSYSITPDPSNNTGPPSENSPSPTTIHDRIRMLAVAECRARGKRMGAIASEYINGIGDQRITTLPYEFRDILRKKGKDVPDKILEKLSLANLYGWAAYSLYDGIVDGENDPSHLPCAAFFWRSLADISTALEPNIAGVGKLFHSIMDRIDEANAWEQKYCRIPGGADAPVSDMPPDFEDLWMLADRSIGHAIGPLAELLSAGYPVNSPEFRDTESLFRHYLIARQLHDDAHDWADDLLRGYINSTSTLILCTASIRMAETKALLNIRDMLPTLRKIFWREIVQKISGAILRHVAAARRARGRSLLLRESGFLEDDLITYASGARRAIAERMKVMDFIDDLGRRKKIMKKP